MVYIYDTFDIQVKVFINALRYISFHIESITRGVKYIIL